MCFRASALTKAFWFESEAVNLGQEPGGIYSQESTKLSHRSTLLPVRRGLWIWQPFSLSGWRKGLLRGPGHTWPTASSSQIQISSVLAAPDPSYIYSWLRGSAPLIYISGSSAAGWLEVSSSRRKKTGAAAVGNNTVDHPAGRFQGGFQKRL